MAASANDDRKEACKTYVEQTKLLVTLASAFLIAPATLIGLLRPETGARLTRAQLYWAIAAEGCFVLSVCFGYVVLGSVAGSQDAGTYDVFRPATRWASMLQFLAYIVGVTLMATLFTLLLPVR